MSLNQPLFNLSLSLRHCLGHRNIEGTWYRNIPTALHRIKLETPSPLLDRPCLQDITVVRHRRFKSLALLVDLPPEDPIITSNVKSSASKTLISKASICLTAIALQDQLSCGPANYSQAGFVRSFLFLLLPLIHSFVPSFLIQHIYTFPVKSLLPSRFIRFRLVLLDLPLEQNFLLFAYFVVCYCFASDARILLFFGRSNLRPCTIICCACVMSNQDIASPWLMVFAFNNNDKSPTRFTC